MADGLITFMRQALPNKISSQLNARFEAIENGIFKTLFEDPIARELLDIQLAEAERIRGDKWCDLVFEKLGSLLSKRSNEDSNTEKEDSPLLRQNFFLLLAFAALQSFIQSNVTGPVLPFSSADLLLPVDIVGSKSGLSSFRKSLIHSLQSDGIAAYSLASSPELLCLADTILTSPPIQKHATGVQWLKLRVDFMHQKLLSETSPTLQKLIYNDVEDFKTILNQQKQLENHRAISSLFKLEKVAVDIHHSLDKDARQEVDQIANENDFQFAITGLLGRRTKYQQRDISQLVVLAKSAETHVAKPAGSVTDGQSALEVQENRPENLDLNDDTLLEKISFTDKAASASTTITDKEALPASLTALEPGNQPLLNPLDSITLLSLASAITNTSPVDGLTREETLPYALRVLEGGSSNWQIYTQALFIRSRIEGYRSRTSERGLLQLQTLVDQILADTLGLDVPEDSNSTTFLPRATEKESAPASERLKYVYALNSLYRWDLEAELASRWVSVGGLRSALGIYERLEMWPEAALCWAAVDREDKGRKIVRRRLFHATNGVDEDANVEEEKWEGAPRDPPPDDAPRLYCILGDFDKDPSMYEKAWEVSGSRYARAQRSLGRQYFADNEFEKCADAYAKALKVNQLNQNSWFAYGCAVLELSKFEQAAEAFSRVVQLDDTDAEAWSNLAAALLRIDSTAALESSETKYTAADTLADEDEVVEKRVDPQKHKRDALKALKRAATLKHDSYRIWDNVLTVSATLAPPAFSDLLIAQKRIIELRGQTDGEQCIDVNILEALVRYVTTLPSESDSTAAEYDPSKPGLGRLVAELVDKDVTPLITASSRLWRVVANLALWRKKPNSSLEAHEKAWRAATTHNPGWENGTEKQWNDVVDGTIDLADAYENLGPMEKTEGLAGGSGELVAKDWKFKARSAVRGIMSKGKDTWEDSEGWNRLKECLDGLKSTS